MRIDSSIQLGLGGGCHWCTEAIFQSVTGISNVKQGWLSSLSPNDSLSEGILLTIDTQIISLKTLIEIHLETHSAYNKHSMRKKYRSAIYYKEDDVANLLNSLLKEISQDQQKQSLVDVLKLIEFKPQTEDSYINYYKNNPNKPFCQRYISPKLEKVKTILGEKV